MDQVIRREGHIYVSPGAQDQIALHAKGLTRQPIYLLWPVPRFVKVKIKLPRNNKETYLPPKFRGRKIIHAPSELDCIPTP